MKPLLFFCLIFFHITVCYSQIKVILDTDIDSDVDDVSALAMLHKLASDKQIEILGVIVTSDDPYAPTCVDAINTYFGNNRIPVGFQKKQSSLKNHSKYTKQISEEFPHKLKSYNDAWESVSLYRKLLSSCADSSVIIITIGHLTSIQNLLQSGSDSYSSLTGKSLALKKVSKWICMGGMFPSGKEANFYRPDPQSTVYCLREWTNPVIFCGWEVGREILSGGPELKAEMNNSSPIYRAFELYNNFAGRASWDQVAILLLTNLYVKYFDTDTNGRCLVEEDGSNRWETGAKSNHSYVVLKPGVDHREIVNIINRMSQK